jgi:hypothetical protein
MSQLLDEFRLIFAYAAPREPFNRPSHRVLMTFFYRAGWQVQFTEADLKTPLPGRSPLRTRKDSGAGTAGRSLGHV